MTGGRLAIMLLSSPSGLRFSFTSSRAVAIVLSIQSPRPTIVPSGTPRKKFQAAPTLPSSGNVGTETSTWTTNDGRVLRLRDLRGLELLELQDLLDVTARARIDVGGTGIEGDRRPRAAERLGRDPEPPEQILAGCKTAGERRGLGVAPVDRDVHRPGEVGVPSPRRLERGAGRGASTS